MLQALVERHVGTGDRRRPRAPVGLDHVAVDLDLTFAELAEVGDRPERAADQPLDLLGPPGLSTPGRLAIGAGVGGPRQHSVLGRHPALAGALEERRHALVQRGRAEHMGIAETDQAGPFRVLGEAGLEHDGTHLVGRAAGGAHGITSLIDGAARTLPASPIVSTPC